MPTASLNIRIDSNVKKQAQELFSALGMDMTTAINVFLRKAIRVQGMPFAVSLDARQMSEGREELAHGKNLHAPFASVDEWKNDLNS